jgi:outer membrane autotransporter protein
MAASPNATIGTAFGFVNGRSTMVGSEAEADTSQAMAYGSYQLGGGAYIGGLSSFSHTRIGVQRRSLGLDLGALAGQGTAISYAVRAEAGVNLQPMRGITLTPRVSLGYEGSSLKGYREQGSTLGLIVDDLGDQRLVWRVGMKLAGTTTPALGWSFSPEARVDFVNTIAGGSNSYDVRFAAAPDLAFALPYAGTDRSWGEVKGGFRVAKGLMSFGAGVESSVGRSDYRDDRAVVDFTVRF